MAQITRTEDGKTIFTISGVSKGLWAWPSPASAPDGFATAIDNMYLPGGVPTSLPGDAVFEDVAYSAASAITLACEYTPTIGGTPVNILGTAAGNIIKVTGAAATILRPGFSTAAGIWWSHLQYGTDLFISNSTDGIWRYDNDTLVPIGAKPITQLESDEASLWAGETADTTNYKEGLQSMYVESTGAQVTMTFTPAANFNAVTGRVDARDYVSDKSPGTDFYHFMVLFTNTGTIDTTNTRVLLTDGDGDSLNFPYTTWDSNRSGTAMPTPVAGTWYDVYLPALDGTETLTFDATNIDTFAFAVDTSAGTLRMNVDDFYVQYANTMPACQILAEWKNILFGFNGGSTTSDEYYFSEVGAPDEYDTLAKNAFKSGGQPVNGVARFFNQLTVGTDTHVFTMSGDPQGQDYPAFLFGINEVTDKTGISSHRSIVRGEWEGQDGLFWIWKRQINFYNGTSVKKISYPIDEYLKTMDVVVANQQFCVGAPAYTKNEIWWTWRRTSTAVNDRVLRLDMQWGAWLPVVGLTTPVVYRTTSLGVEKLLTIDATSRKLYAQYDATNFTFVGTAIEYALELPALAVQGTEFYWIMNWLQWLSNTGDMTVQFRQGDTLLSLIADAYETAETITMTAVGEYGKNLIGERSVWLQLKFASSGTKMELQPPFIILAHSREQAFTRNTP